MADLVAAIDFGATRIKGAIFDRGAVRAIAERSSVPPLATQRGRFEVDPRALRSAFTAIIEDLVERAGAVPDRIALCTEMHGFIVATPLGEALTPYISWQDERSLESRAGESSVFDQAKGAFGSSYQATTGLTLRPGLPILGLRTVLDDIDHDDVLVLSLGDWLAAQGALPTYAHATSACGLGVIELARLAPSEELIAWAGRSRTALHFLPIDTRIDRVSTVRVRDREVPLLAPIGDQAAALAGAGLAVGRQLSVNVGTGSQVSCLQDTIVRAPGVDARPWFTRDRFLHTITHLPAGRALNTYVGFLDDVARTLGATTSAWSLLSAVTDDEISEVELRVDLAVFPAARGYVDGGRIVAIREGAFDARAFAAALLRAMADQYVRAADEIDVTRALPATCLSGGVLAKLPTLRRVLERRLERVVESESNTVDDTLVGLARLASASIG